MDTATQKKLDDAKQFVFNIHIRARNNAFAHREAADEAKSKNDRWTLANLVATTVALLLTALALVATSEMWTGFSVVFSVLSILAAFLSLFTQSILLYKRFDVKETSHHFLQGSFQHISQRAREIERPSFNVNSVDALIDDLERDFALLKARAVEPDDKHFRAAAELQKVIRNDPAYSGALSFAGYKNKVNDKATVQSKPCPPADE